MRPIGDEEIFYGEAYHGTVGAAHGVSGDAPPEDVVERLHQVVEEITGEPVSSTRRRIGFL